LFNNPRMRFNGSARTLISKVYDFGGLVTTLLLCVA
jgi:hypothetical protein